MLQIEVSQDLEALLADEQTWNALARGVPFRETSWLGPWWRQFGAGREAVVLVARDDDNVIRGLLPLYRAGGSASQRTLAMIGDGLAFSDHMSVLANQADATDVAKAMGQYLARCAADPAGGWDVICIDGVVEGDRAMAALATALKLGGASLHAQSRMSTWYRAAETSWDDHLKTFAKTQRRKMRRWSEKIEQTTGMEKVLPQSAEQVETLLDAMITLHQQRWTEAGQPGSYANPAFREFIHHAARDFFRRGRLHLPTLALDQKTIGGELHFLGGDQRLYCYSSGYDIQAAELEPGRILSTETLRDLYRLHLAGIDYMRGDEPYKKRMSATPTRLFQFRVIAPNWLPRLRHAAWCTQFELKQWVRRRTGRRPLEVADLSA